MPAWKGPLPILRAPATPCRYLSSQIMPKPTSWSEQLRDIRWQENRLRILEQRNWTCETCSRDKHKLALDREQIQVHHHFYDGRQAWEYRDDDLSVLCDTCHDQTEDAITNLRALFGQFTYYEMNGFVCDFWKAIKAGNKPKDVLSFVQLCLTKIAHEQREAA